MRLFFVVLFFYTALYAQRITKIANDYLPANQERVVVFGNATGALRIRLDTVITFTVESIYWGNLDKREINIIYPYIDTPKVLNTEKKIVVLKRMNSPSNFQIIQEFSNKDKLAKQKLQSLEKLLAIEKLPEKLAKEKHFAHCIEGFKSDDTWQRWNSLWEWSYITTTRQSEISQEMLNEVLSSYVLIPELSLKKRLRETIIVVKRSLKKEVSEVVEKTETKSNEEEIEKALVKLKKDNIVEQLEAIHSIAQYPGSLSHGILVEHLQHISNHIRSAALFHLRVHGTPKDINIILEVLQNDSSLRVRKNAIKALSLLGATEAIPEIKKYLNIKYTQKTAQKALLQLEYNK